MADLNNTPNWLAWLIPPAAGATLGALWAGARRLLVSVTREELEQRLKEQEDAREVRRLQLHNENLENFRNVFDRMGKVEQSQARMEGMLSGRYPRIER